MQAPDLPAQIPCEEVLALHDLGRSYGSFSAFQPELVELLGQAARLDACVAVTRALGILEPLSGEHVPPEAIQIQGPNYRESLVANGVLSRNRAVLVAMERAYGSLEALRGLDIYLAEALTGFALWLRRQLGQERLTCSEYLTEAELAGSDAAYQDLYALNLPDASFDLVLCNDLFQHVPDLDHAFREIARVLRPGGRLIATCPLAFGQQDSIVEVRHRPGGESLVYQIPGWEILDQLREAGCGQAEMHHIASWKHGVLGMDLPGVLVIEAQR